MQTFQHSALLCQRELTIFLILTTDFRDVEESEPVGSGYIP